MTVLKRCGVLWGHRGVLAAALLMACGACGQGESPPPPPPPVGTVPGVPGTPTTPGVPGTPTTPVPPGTTNVTVTANSTPAGASVTGGGRDLGVTPLTTMVPVPTPAAGQPPQTFDFTFTKEGFHPTTLQASPTNGQIVITAALAPATAPVVDPTMDTPTPAGDDGVFTVNGRGGGVIQDMGSARATANVSQTCIAREVTAVVRGNHTFHGDLRISLTAPSGRNFSLFSGRGNPFRSHRVRNAAGQPVNGRWVLTVRDRQRADMGRLSGFALRIRCQ